MDASNENEANSASKAGIITWALFSDRKVVILFIACGLAMDSVNLFAAFSRFTNHFYSGAMLALSIQQAIYASFTFSLCFKRTKYIDHVTHFERNAKIQSNNESMEAYMKRNRYIFHALVSINYVIYFSLISVPFIDKLIRSNVSILQILIFGLKQTGFLCNFALLRFFVEACLYIHTCFMRVEHEINTSNKSPNLLSISDIRKVRQLYCFAVETTEKLNSVLWPVIATYFVFSILNSHFAFVKTITDLSVGFIFICAGQLLTCILIAYNMIYINHLATRIYQSAYSLSYKTDSLFAKKEVQHFLLRIERGDVGFSFLDLFVITPTCVTTLATISLTLALAEPTLLK